MSKVGAGCLSAVILLFLLGTAAVTAEPSAQPHLQPQPTAPASPDPVSWQSSTQHRPVHFAADLVPILPKAGCNQGSCHGAASGKGGLKQSLRGWDPAFDWEQITKDVGGKRIDKEHPEKSLVFLKPTGQVSHGGGQRFAPDSAE